MDYLLDTNTLIWALVDSPKLSKETRNIILNNNNTIYYSLATLWEYQIKSSKHKNVLPWTLEKFIDLIEISGFKKIYIQEEDILNLQSLEDIHKNPFDRMVISQAQTNNLVLITSDEEIKKYNVKTAN